MNIWCEPELSLAIRMSNVDMDARLLPGEKEQAKRSVTDNCRGHGLTLSDWRSGDHFQAHNSASLKHCQQRLFINHGHAQFQRFGQFATGLGAGHDVIGFLAD